MIDLDELERIADATNGTTNFCTIGSSGLLELIRRLREAERDANRYRWLRGRDIETIDNGGIFAGSTPDNFVLNGDDLDEAIDAEMNYEELGE